MNDPFVFITSARQYAAFKQHPLFGEESTLVASPFEVLVELEELGVSHVNLWDYYQPDEVAGHQAAAWKLCDAVAEATQGSIQIYGIDVTPCFKNDLFSALRVALTARDVIGRILDDYQPAEILHFSEMEKAMYWDPPDCEPDIYNAMVAWCAQRRNIATELLTIPAALHGKPEAPVIEEPRVVGSFDGAWLENKPPCMVFAEASYCLEQREILHGQHPEIADWLLVSSDLTTTDAPYLPLSEFRSFPFVVDDVEKSVQAARRMLPGCLAGHEEAIVDNPFLDFIWDSWAQWLREGIVSMCLGQMLGAAFKPGTVITGSDVAGAARGFAEGIRSQGSAVICIDHWGTKVAVTHDRQRGAVNHAAVSGEYELSGHQANRPETVQCRAIGTLRTAQSFSASFADARNGPVGERIKIVVFTAQTMLDGEVFTYVDFRKFCEGWNTFLALCKQHPEWDVVIKTHPAYDNYAYYESAPFRAVENICYRRDATIDDVLEGADLALIMNVQTWVLPEIIVRGHPVIYLKNAAYISYNAQMESGGTVIVDDPDQLEEVIERLARDDVYRKQVLDDARAFMPRAVTASRRGALENLLTFAEDVRCETDQPDPATRWIMNMIMLIASLRYRGLPWSEFEQQLGILKKRGAVIDFSTTQRIELAQIGPYLLHLFMRKPVIWPVNAIFPLRAAWRVYWCIPLVLRPDLGLLRSCGTLAFSHAVTSCKNPIGRCYYRLWGLLIAPGRIFRRAA